VLNGGGLGTPSSGTVTNLTGTASININGTVGATTPTTGAFTTVAVGGVPTLQGELNVFKTGSAPTLYVQGDTSNTTTQGIIRIGGASGRSASIQGYREASSNAMALRFYSYNSADQLNYEITSGGNSIWSVGGTEAMRLNSTGLGIGATSPTQVFSIGGLGSTADTYKSMSFQSGSTEVNYVRAVVQDGNNYALSFGTYATGLAERMRITAAGNVAIGATTASNKLEVAGNARFYTAANGDLSITHSSLVTTLQAAGSITLAFGTNNTEKARISTAGGFSVGTTADAGAGGIYATGNITAYYSSDRKFKENVQDIPDALDIVTSIGAKTFDWTDEYLASHGGEDEYFQPKQSFGVIAQDVQAVFPQAVRTREDGSLAVDYEKLAILSFGAIGQLLKRVEALEAK
jgi:hypothetical protein